MRTRPGRSLPEDVRVATSDYREEMDVLAAFIGEKCIEDPNSIAPSGDLYKTYTAWAEENGEHALSQLGGIGLAQSETDGLPAVGTLVLQDHGQWIRCGAELRCLALGHAVQIPQGRLPHDVGPCGLGITRRGEFARDEHAHRATGRGELQGALEKRDG